MSAVGVGFNTVVGINALLKRCLLKPRTQPGRLNPTQLLENYLGEANKSGKCVYVL